MLPEGTTLVVVLDLNLSHDVFVLLYENEIRHGSEIVGFLGRELSRSNVDNQANFNFIASRQDDKILRAVVAVSKNNDGMINSIVYRYFGFDVYAFLTRYGNSNAPQPIIVALRDFHLVPLDSNRDLRCVLTDRSLYDSSIDFGRRMDKSTLPVSVHDIVRLNQEFEDLHDRMTRQQLEILLGDRIRH
ncbi:hypothetical protein EPN87_01550 [archaeon]|nr:MAG: hypothetical protein EPN87_01550 [archaeon]